MRPFMQQMTDVPKERENPPTKKKPIILLRFILYETINIENKSSEKIASNGDEQNPQVFIYFL